MFSFFKKRKEAKQHPAGFLYGGYYSNEYCMARDYKTFAEEGYQKNAVAHACIDYIASAVSSVPLIAFSNEGGELKRLDPSHPLNKLLRRPNPAMGGGTFFKDLISYKLISGNAFLMRYPLQGEFGILAKKQPPTQLWWVRPDFVEIKPGDQGYPSAYVVTKRQGESLTVPVDQLTGKSDMLHLKNFNPLKLYQGLSKFEPAAYSVDSFSLIMKWNQRLVNRGARPSGAFSMPGELSDSQFARLQEQIESQFSGADNAGRPLLLESGLKFEEMQINPKDMDYINSKNSSARDICLAFGVPPQLIGLPDAQTYSNYAEAKLAFWQSTVIPILSMLTEELTNWLADSFGNEIYIDFDKNDIDALIPIREKLFSMLQKADFLTPDEKRQLTGYDNIEGGDRLYIDPNKMPADMIDELATADTQAAKKHFIKSFPELAFEKLQKLEQGE